MMHNEYTCDALQAFGTALKRTRMVLLIIRGWWIDLCCTHRPRSLLKRQSTKTGSILGTVVDISDDPIPDATVVLQGPAGDRLAAVTKEDGSFAFDQCHARNRLSDHRHC